MSELLVEVGTEEIPAGMAAGGARALAEGLAKRLEQARVGHGEVRAYATPRRLVAVIAEVAEGQPDVEELVTGPPKGAAYDAQGNPTKAALGFAAKFGKTAADLTLTDTPKGPYLAVKRTEKGQPTLALLPALVSEAIAQVPWRKSMRWGDPVTTGDVAFVRPVHWIVALYGGEVVPCAFAGVRAGRATRGHRFLAPGPIEVKDAADLVARLRQAFVIVDAEERRSEIEAKLAALAEQAGGRLLPLPALLEEVTYLVEYPVGILGRIDERFVRELPKEVIVAAMTGHQRYFPLVRGEPPDYELVPAFATIAGTVVKAPEVVQHGNERVLKARLDDALFFFAEDSRRLLAERVDALGGMVFQKQLGTMREKAERLAVLAAEIGGLVGADPETCRRAALLCKADLTTKMVGEFPDLQGVMGRIYAAKDGEPAELAEAVFEHYLPRGEKDEVPASTVGRVVALADWLDTLVGGFLAGLQPTGSGDPFGLRRAALGVIRILVAMSTHLKLSALVSLASSRYQAQGKMDPLKEPEVRSALADFFRGRLRAYHAERYPVGLVDMVLEVGGKPDDPADLDLHLAEARRALDDGLLSKVAEPAKRARNITQKSEQAAAAFEPRLARQPEEHALADVYLAVREELRRRLDDRRYYEAYHEVDRRLRDPLHAFFEKVFVMDEDPAVRKNRLALLRGIHDALAPLGDFSRLGV